MDRVQSLLAAFALAWVGVSCGSVGSSKDPAPKTTESRDNVHAAAGVLEGSPAHRWRFHRGHRDGYHHGHGSQLSFLLAYQRMIFSDYLDILEEKARAALELARKRGRRIDAQTDGFRSMKRDLEQSLKELDRQRARYELKQERIRTHSRSVEKLREGIAKPEVLEAAEFLLDLANVPEAELSAVEVPPLGEDQFASRGGYIVETGPDGRKVIKPNEVEPFAGGHLRSYIQFLKDHRQNPKAGTEASAALKTLFDRVQKVGRAWLARLEKRKEDLDQKRQNRWAHMERMIEALNEKMPEPDSTEK